MSAHSFLQYRDLAIPMGKYPLPKKDKVVPGSDGAGTVVAVGKHVNRLKVGDRVATLFSQAHIGGSPTFFTVNSALGGTNDGVFRQYGAFDQNGLVILPESLSFLEGATLPCAALTAWNSFYGLSDKKLLPGQWVLTQGTGGVSIFAVQFAKAAGARVVATTSSAEKAKLLEKLGADHIINYKETTDWGSKAKKFTGGVGFDHIIEVAGPKSMAQSLEAVKMDGVISIIGFLGGVKGENEPSFLQCLSRLCTVRGVIVGNRGQMEDMCAAIEANLDKLRPVIDPKVFKLDQLKEAYAYQFSAKHQAKVCIEIE
jgi:NADPH:quinone reductase-like Zn-dependent oxidoreductase